VAYVTVVVQSRLAGFDDSLEEAALDLGTARSAVLPAVDPAGDAAGCSRSRWP
jgi:ABC-type spermidine/putrescine transport system permease subunit II